MFGAHQSSVPQPSLAHLIVAGCRVLVQYSRSMASYTSLVRWHPQLLLAATKRRAEAVEGELRRLLPPEFDPATVIKSWPLLLLSRPRLLSRRWWMLKGTCGKVGRAPGVDAGRTHAVSVCRQAVAVLACSCPMQASNYSMVLHVV